MYLEKRPTCVTVIGWAWIVIGTLMLFSALMALYMSATMMSPEMRAASGQQMPLIFRLFPLFAVVEAAVSVAALISGINFLRLKAWSRCVLELLTWLLLLFVVGFMIFWIVNWLSMTSAVSPPGFASSGAIMGIFILAIYGVPLGIMLRFLRGETVKQALS